MNKPVRVQRKRTKGWKAPADAVYVGRGSIWGNPWSIASTGSAQVAVNRYEDWILAKEYCGNSPYRNIEPKRRDSIIERLSELRGKKLMCWCKESEPCHADVLLRLANEVSDANS